MAVTLHLKFLPRFSVYLPTGKLTQRPDPHFTLRKYNLVNGVLIENTRKSRVRSVYCHFITWLPGYHLSLRFSSTALFVPTHFPLLISALSPEQCSDQVPRAMSLVLICSLSKLTTLVISSSFKT